ncbi:MAG: DoxX family protein [Phycisphaeraceae bacterium]|nr:DoxX family protein [Phycisphaeraceae bacterium]
MNSQLSAILNSIGLLILRLGMGGYMLTHGWGKVQRVYAGNLDDFGDPLGIGSGVSLVLVAFAEFVCAILVMLGLLTRLACFPIVFTMAVAAFIAHADDPWILSQGMPSKQPALTYLIPFLALMFTGAGRYSLDKLLFRRKPR